jgi:hypothetical protein
MTDSLTIPAGVTIDELMRMTSTEILITYGPDVHALVARLQASGMVARDGRTNADLALQAEMRRKIAEEGDCGPADLYKAELEGKAYDGP